MLRLIGRRLLISVPVVFVVTALSFGLLQLLPGNAAEALLGPQATPQEIAGLTRSLGLDHPAYQQYWTWLVHLAHGNLGASLANSQSVTSMLNQRLGVSVSLLVGALLGAIIVGGAIGILSASRPGVLSRLLDLLAIGGLALPAFWLALILVFLLSTKARLLPALGYVAPGTSLASWARFLILPWIALGATMATAIAKQTRDAMSDALAAPYITSLRANGTPEWKLIFKHALRNAAIPVVTVIALLFVSALSYAVIAEQIFALPGLGSALVSATTNRDIPVIQGIALYLTVIVVIVNLLVDLAYGWLNPKVRAA
jgi:peptide/nickel transport system permease protein